MNSRKIRIKSQRRINRVRFNRVQPVSRISAGVVTRTDPPFLGPPWTLSFHKY